MSTSARGHDFIFVSLENWDEIWRRNQFVCAELSRRHPRSKILFVGLARDISHAVRRGKISNLLTTATYSAPGFENITVTHAPKYLPNSLAFGRKANEISLCRHVRATAAKLELKNPVLWLNDHAAGFLTDSIQSSAVIYDITDDWTTLSQSPGTRKQIVEQDEVLCRKSDATIVCSTRLFELKRKLTKSLHLVPNGVDAAHYAAVLDDDKPGLTAPAKWAGPVYGYTGTIHGDRLDVDLVDALAARIKHGSLVFVGPDFLTPAESHRLRQHENIFFVGPVPYAKIPQYMREFDVCIVPHQVTPFTESLNPIKLWEYLAAGKPIVTTPVAGFRDYPDLVRLASGVEPFLAALRETVLENRNPSRTQDLTDARQKVAREHSWTARVDEIERVVESAVRQRSQSVKGLGA